MAGGVTGVSAGNEAEGDVHEQGEESAKENDPIVELAFEPDAETEPRASQDAQPATDVPTSTAPQLNETYFILFYFFFHCVAELAIKPCWSSRSKMRGEFGIPKLANFLT